MAELEIQGMEELMNKLNELGTKANKIQKQALEKAADPIENEAKATSAWSDKSGTLRPTIQK